MQVQEKLNAYGEKTSRQRYAKSEEYAAFRQSIYVRHDSSDPTLASLTPPQEVQHPNEAMPPVVEFLPRGLDVQIDVCIGG